MNFKQFKKRYQRSTVQHYPHKVGSEVLVSVLIQTYNHETSIQRCLEKVLEQKTNFEFEILLGEDASCDETRKICIEYAEKFPEKIRLFLHDTSNKFKTLDMVTGNFNAFYNFYNTTGSYIAFCEGDDYWTDPLKLQKQIEYLIENPQVSFSFHKFEENFLYKKETFTLLDQPDKDLGKNEIIKLKAHPLLSTICFKKNFYELPEEMFKIINVDSFLISILGLKGSAHFHSDIKPTIYNRHSGGIWTNLQRKKQIELKILTTKSLFFYYAKKMHLTIALHFLIKLIYHFKHLKNFKQLGS